MDLNNALLLKKILNNDLIALTITTPELNILYCNPYFEKLVEKPARAILHSNLADYLAPQHKVQEVQKILESEGEVHRQEIKLSGHDDEKYLLLSAEKAQFINELDNDHYLFYMIDITEQKNIYSELLQAQKMEGIGLLAGGIAHDFNNILGSISGYAELMKNFVHSPEAIDMIGVIEHESNKAAKLIKSLLQYARGSKRIKTNFKIDQVIQDTYVLLKKTLSQNIQFITELDENLPVAYGNPVEIQQCLINLCLNSKDAMPEGGEIRIKVVPYEKEGNGHKLFLKIIISDTGEGIPDDIKGKIFEPFFSTKEKVTASGLGLYMVNRIITEHGGWIDVRDNKPHGTTFELFIPALKKEIEDTEIVDEVEWIDGNQKLVMIIDDEESIVLLIKQFLERMNFRTLIAHNGREGLEKFREYKNEIDLILLDYMMPMMNGKEVYIKIREEDPDIPVMLFTGVDDEEMITEFLQLGVSSVIKKPFSAFDIVKKIRTVISWNEQ